MAEGARLLVATFVRTLGSPDRFYCRRSDGGETSWSFPTFGDAPPHDLAHLIVESAFDLRAGFYGRVDRGHDVARINADANRQGGQDKYRGFGDDLSELVLAETLVNLPWTDPDTRDDELVALVDAALPATAAKTSIDAGFVAAIRTELGRVARGWAALKPKGALRFSFFPDHPRAGFPLREPPA